MVGTEWVGKSVEELSGNGNSPPEAYILKDGIGGTDFPTLDLPIIDLSRLSSQLDSFGLALTHFGCVQLVNHGMEEGFLENVLKVSKEFFSLPMEEKLKCGKAKGDYDGYGNDTFSQKEALDWNDRLFLVVKPESQRKLNVWPQNPPSFRKVLVELAEKMEEVDKKVLKGMAKYLKLEDDEWFVKQYGKNPIAISRFNFYPPCRRADAVLGSKAHSDASTMTYLLQDAEGLQILKDGHWFNVPLVPNAIVVNVGDQIEIMSNGIFKSPMHRVVTNPDKERFSVVTFLGPDITAEIRPEEGLIDEKRPRMFNNLVDYPKYFRLIGTDQKRPIDLLRL